MAQSGSNTASVELLRQLPQVEEMLHDLRLQGLAAALPRAFVVDAVRAAIEEERERILAGERTDASGMSDRIADRAALGALALTRPSLRRVVNATGVIVHTNLGRSVLAPSAVRAVEDVARGYSTLEYDTASMARGSRHDHCERLICALTGAEAAIAVNNNAAAVLMVLSEFASGHEAVVSRGEQVEIGGSFRIPDIMEQSGACMREVGATNKTHVRDYERATTDATAMYLKVHPSNFRLIGFVESVEVRELRELAAKENARRKEALGPKAPEVLVYEDQGSGALMRLPVFGDYAEPVVSDSLRQGADLVSFSGDKLLGGPQAGIIAGRKDLIERLKTNPLARALRLDKMTLAALEATLRLYLDPDAARREIPTLRMLTESLDEVHQRAIAVMEAVRSAIPAGCATLDVIDEVARAGGGALPMCNIPTYCVRVTFERGEALACERHMVQERDVPVVPRIHKETLLIDARSLLEGEQAEVAASIAEYFQTLQN